MPPHLVKEDAAMPSNPPEVMTLTEVAEYLRIPKSTAYKLCQERKIPDQKVGRHWRFRRDVIDGWLGEQPLSTHGQPPNP